MLLAENAEIDSGTSCRFSSRLREVTTISSMARFCAAAKSAKPVAKKSHCARGQQCMLQPHLDLPQRSAVANQKDKEATPSSLQIAERK